MEESKMSTKKTTFEDIKNALWAGANTISGLYVRNR